MATKYGSFKGITMLVGVIIFALGPIYFIHSEKEIRFGLPDGVQYIKRMEGSHIVLLSGSILKKPSQQQYAANYICEDYSFDGPCEVYLFRDINDIPSTFPIMRDKATVMGYYKRQPGSETQFRRLYMGSHDVGG